MAAAPRRSPALLGSSPARDTETLAGLVDEAMEVCVRRLLQHLSARGRTLATAESCTGGLLASLFTDVEGVSHVFDRGIVTYDEQAKCELLGVDPDLIAEHGVVSREVATAMAEGLLDCSHADVGLAVTGYAGSGREPGLVFIGLSRAREGQHDHPTIVRELRLGAVGRGPVRMGVLRAALKLLEEVL